MMNVSFAVIVTARAGVLAAKGRDGRGRYKFPRCVLHINAVQKSNPLQYKSIWSVLHINAQKSSPFKLCLEWSSIHLWKCTDAQVSLELISVTDSLADQNWRLCNY